MRRPGRPRTRDWVGLGTLCLLVVAIDQASKAAIVASLEIGERVDVVPGLDIVHVTNPGIAFGFLSDGPGLILPVTLVALAAIVVWFAFEGGRRSRMWLPAGLLTGGAIGNLIDRLRLDHVTDFIDLPYWPSFNVADAAITVGVVILLVMVMFGPETGSEPDPERERPDGEGRKAAV
ncbi:signal peptidase II [Thermoleophilia bacterium SCSIO 60948]|nr:signal peptidase II [Thermoleophilia bacterium SCSIO 60948]